MQEAIKNLVLDIDRLNHFEEQGNERKIAEYKELIVYHVKELLSELE